VKSIPPPEARDLERRSYWQGQTLRSRDFRDGIAIDAQFRWWHLRAMHRVFGIVAGFSVEQAGNFVLIRRGLAYDWFGSEVILSRDRSVPLPCGERPMMLLARYCRNPDRNCAPGSCEVRETAPEFTWTEACGVAGEDGVPLAIWKDRKLVMIGRRIRPMSRPRILSGTTISGGTNWEPWIIPMLRERDVFALQTRIDLSSAGFAQAPCCFAWLEQTPAKRKETTRFEICWHGIDTVSAAGFTFRLLIWAPEIAAGERIINSGLLGLFRERREFFVSWLAMESCRKYTRKLQPMEVECEHP
jgi:hypothetical protein